MSPTVAGAASMSAMHGTSMHGMSMPAAACASFVVMWMAMMLPMMLPSLAPALRRYHRVVDRSATAARAGRLTAVMAAGYYAVWAGIGVALLPLGAAFAAAMRQPALGRVAPHLVGAVVLVAGAMQLSTWKARHLAGCDAVPSRAGTATVTAAAAWRHGLRLGAHCSLSCAGPMAILLAIGMMDLPAMALVTAAITAERVVPDGIRVARAVGAVAVVMGLVLLARAA